MIYSTQYKDALLAGRVSLTGERSKVLTEFRMLSRAMCDYFGVDVVLEWTRGLAHDPLTNVSIQIDITPDQGGYYIPEGGAENEKH